MQPQLLIFRGQEATNFHTSFNYSNVCVLFYMCLTKLNATESDGYS